MKYVVYCDESRHVEAPDNQYMAIGSLWLPRDEKDKLSRAFRDVCRANQLHAEVKWSKTSRACLESYKALVDFFFAQRSLQFRVIVVDQHRLDFSRFSGGDKELGFYKFYYELLEKWITEQDQYLILLDFKQNKDAHRYTMLHKCLIRKLNGKAWVQDLTVVDSKQTPLAQLCDLLTGATAAAWCNHFKTASTKKELVEYIGKKRREPLIEASPSSAVGKFNVFHIRLQ